jgi:hypothetical protein
MARALFSVFVLGAENKRNEDADQENTRLIIMPSDNIIQRSSAWLRLRRRIGRGYASNIADVTSDSDDDLEEHSTRARCRGDSTGWAPLTLMRSTRHVDKKHL